MKDVRVWTSVGVVQLLSRRGPRQLTVNVVPVPFREAVWIVNALEGPSTPEEAKVMEHVEQSLENHAHHLIGKFPDLPRAIEAAELYEMTWTNRKEKLAPCECGDIA